MFKARESSVDTWDLIAGGFYESYSAVPIPCLYLKDGAALTARHFIRLKWQLHPHSAWAQCCNVTCSPDRFLRLGVPAMAPCQALPSEAHCPAGKTHPK